jgi:hypothetical protein
LLYSYTPTLTITPSALAATYGDAVPNLTGYAYNALTSGQYLSAGDFADDTVTGSLTGSTTYSQGSNVGLYNINYSSGTLTSALGYGFTYANNATALNVGTRALSVAADAKNKTYGTVTDPALTYTLTSGSFYASDGFSGALSRVAGETVVGGPYAILQNTLSAGSNYTISYTGANLNINPYTLSVAADAKSKIYGAADPALTYSYGTLQNGDTSAIFSGALSRAAGETPGSYVIGQNTLSLSANYSLNYINGLLTITSTALPDTVVRVGQNPSLLTAAGMDRLGDPASGAAFFRLAEQEPFAWNTLTADADAGTRYHLRTGSDPTAAQPFLRWLDSMRAILTLHPTLAKRLGLEPNWRQPPQIQP